MIDGWVWAWRIVTRARFSARRSSAGVFESQAPDGSTGPTPCQTRIPAASSFSSSARSSGCWERVALAPRAFSSSTIAVWSSGVSASPWPRMSSWMEAPRRIRGAPFSVRVPPDPPTWRRPTFSAVLALVPDLEIHVVEVGARRRPEARVVDRHLRLGHGEVALGDGHRAELQIGLAVFVAEGAGRRERPIRRVVVDLDADRDLGRARRAGGQGRGDRRVDEVARAERAHRHLAVDPAEVEPGSVVAGQALGVRVPVVGPHDEQVGARPGVEVVLEREVGPDVGRAEVLAVEPDVGAEVDRLEAHRVAAAGRGRERGPVPGDRPGVVLDPGCPGDRRGVGHVGDRDGPPGEPALRPPVAEAPVGRVAGQDPARAERDPVGRTLDDRRLVRRVDRVGAGAARRADEHREEDDDAHGERRAGHCPQQRNAPLARRRAEHALEHAAGPHGFLSTHAGRHGTGFVYGVSRQAARGPCGRAARAPRAWRGAR